MLKSPVKEALNPIAVIRNSLAPSLLTTASSQPLKPQHHLEQVHKPEFRPQTLKNLHLDWSSTNLP